MVAVGTEQPKVVESGAFWALLTTVLGILVLIAVETTPVWWEKWAAIGALGAGLLLTAGAYNGTLSVIGLRVRTRRRTRLIRKHREWVFYLSDLTQKLRFHLMNDSAHTRTFGYATGNIWTRIVTEFGEKAAKAQQIFTTWATLSQESWNAASGEIYRLCRGEARYQTDAFLSALDLLKAEISGFCATVETYVNELRRVQGVS